VSDAPLPAGEPGFWTLDHVAAALGTGPTGPSEIARISTDTRTVGAGDLFVALKGERFDAHGFLRDAVDGGARAVVVSDVTPARQLGVPVFAVADTLAALGALARYRRRVWGGAGKLVIAVAGSNGKTTTKELLRAALGSVLEVHATSSNYNNQVGVPLTLLATPDAADVAIIEVGTSARGEIAALRRIVEPDVAVLTSVGEEHLEGLGDLAGVLAEECEICADVPLAIVPAAQPEIVDAVRSRARQVVTAGLDIGDVRADRWGLSADGLGELQVDGAAVAVPLRGTHNLANAMLAFAVSRACGIPAATAAAGIGAMPAPPMRAAWQRIGRATLINDAYNANPASARAALDLLASIGAQRQRVAVLGTMRELGAASPTLHDEIARRALASSSDVLAGLGEFAAALQRVGHGDPRVVTAPDVDELWPRLRDRLVPDAVILLKASRGVRLERIVPLLTEWAQSNGST
jgi:UDP-N-acetylmuramoyl-tripeptide--D-alanyl-D-alanine ligase